MGSLVSPLLENPSWIALLLGYSLAASGSLRSWIGVSQLQLVTPEEPKPLGKRFWLKSAAAAIVLIGAEVAVLRWGNTLGLDIVVISIFAPFNQYCLWSLVSNVLDLEEWSVFRLKGGGVLMPCTFPTDVKRLSLFLATAGMHVATFLYPNDLFVGLLLTAFIYRVVVTQNMPSLKISNVIKGMLVLVMGVCGALGSFAFLVGFEDDSSPKSPDRSPSPATVTYMLTWVASVNSLYPGVLIALLLRFDYHRRPSQLSSTAPPLARIDVSTLTDLPELLEMIAPNTDGLTLPLNAPTDFPRPYSTTALISFLVCRIALIGLWGPFVGNESDGPFSFELVAVGVDFLSVTVGVALLALARGEWREVMDYEEVWSRVGKKEARVGAEIEEESFVRDDLKLLVV